MASVQLDGGKHTTGQACSGDIPHDFRERENYANAEIDKSRTYLNQIFGCQTGIEARSKLKKRIAECDALHPPKRIKKDRKTSLEIHIPAPRENLDNEQLRIFFTQAYAAMTDMFGKENVIYGVSHFDEVHKYLDPTDKQWHESREGLHIVIIPWTDGMEWIPEERKKGLNMDNFYRRFKAEELPEKYKHYGRLNLPTLINERLDKICNEVFGFDYQDGTKTSNKAKVEELKAVSKQYQETTEKIEQAQDILVEKKTEIKAADRLIDNKIDELADTINNAYAEIKDRTERLDSCENEFKLKNNILKKEQDKVKQILEVNTGIEYPDDFDAIMADFSTWVDSVQAQDADIAAREADLREKEAQLLEQDRQNEINRQALMVQKETLNKQEKSIKEQFAELNNERRLLHEQNEQLLRDERIRMQQENEIKFVKELKKQGIDVQKFREWNCLQSASAINPANTLPKREKTPREIPNILY